MPDSKDASQRRRHSLRWLQRVFLLLAILSIGAYLIENRNAVESLFSKVEAKWLLAAAMWLGLLHPIMAYAYWCIQRGLGIERSYKHTLASYIARLPARFVPGGVWHSLARYADIRSDDQASTSILGRMFVVEVIAVASGGFLASGILEWLISDAGQPASPLTLLMLAMGMIGSFAPLVFASWRRRTQTFPHWFAAIAAVGIVWASVGAAFALVARAIGGPFLQCASPAISAAYTVAATTGYVAIFAPQGWGVTDAVFVLLRPCPISLAALLSAILAFRLITVTVDMCVWVIGSALMKWRAR